LGQVDATHHERHSGTSTYTFLESLKVWSRLAFSFSIQPLRLGIWIGFIVALIGLLGIIVVLVMYLIAPTNYSDTAVGWASLMTSLLFFSGIQIALMGLLGEYVGRSYLNLNRSPQSIIAETANFPPQGREGV
jgi:undecaprenyl-phosphate 4-deoxy-4-formamido-L-arabinose transferase